MTAITKPKPTLFLSGSGTTAQPVAYLAQPGPSAAPSPWRRDGSTIRYDEGGAVLPATVTGGSKGRGTLNAVALFQNGDPVGSASGAVNITQGPGITLSPNPILASGEIEVDFTIVAAIAISPTAPPSPKPNQLWWSSDSAPGGGILYISYNDGTSTQWVQASPSGLSPSGGTISGNLTITGSLAATSVALTSLSLNLPFPTVFGPGNTPITAVAINHGNTAYPVTGMSPQGVLEQNRTTMVVPASYTVGPWPNTNYSAYVELQGTGSPSVPPGKSAVNYFGVMFMPANNTNGCGVNTVISNTAAANGFAAHNLGNDFTQMVGYEIDVNIWAKAGGAAPAGTYDAIRIVGGGDAVRPLQGAYGVQFFPLAGYPSTTPGVRTPFTALFWSQDRAAGSPEEGSFAIRVGSTDIGSNVDSQSLTMVARATGPDLGGHLRFLKENQWLIQPALLVGPDITAARLPAGAALGVRGAGDVSALAVFSGVTKGVRIGTNSTGSTIEGVDNTGTTSYQPLALNGSSLALSAVGGSTVNLIGNSFAPSVDVTATTLGDATHRWAAAYAGLARIGSGTAQTVPGNNTIQAYNATSGASAGVWAIGATGGGQGAIGVWDPNAGSTGVYLFSGVGGPGGIAVINNAGGFAASALSFSAAGLVTANNGLTVNGQITATGATAEVAIIANNTSTEHLLVSNLGATGGNIRIDDGATRLYLRNSGGSLQFLKTDYSAVLWAIGQGVPAAGSTIMSLSYNPGAGNTTQTVTVGAADSGGTGFRVLRVPN